MSLTHSSFLLARDISWVTVMEQLEQMLLAASEVIKLKHPHFQTVNGHSFKYLKIGTGVYTML